MGLLQKLFRTEDTKPIIRTRDDFLAIYKFYIANHETNTEVSLEKKVKKEAKNTAHLSELMDQYLNEYKERIANIKLFEANNIGQLVNATELYLNLLIPSMNEVVFNDSALFDRYMLIAPKMTTLQGIILSYKVAEPNEGTEPNRDHEHKMMIMEYKLMLEILYKVTTDEIKKIKLWDTYAKSEDINEKLMTQKQAMQKEKTDLIGKENITKQDINEINNLTKQIDGIDPVQARLFTVPIVYNSLDKFKQELDRFIKTDIERYNAFFATYAPSSRVR
jgi:hypothetical protein